MANQQDIIEAIADQLTLPVADIDMESSLQTDLGLNPIEIADLMNSLSTKFNFIFEQGETERLETVGDLVELIEDKLLE